MAKIEDNTQAAIVDAVAALLLTVSGQVRAAAPGAAADLLAKRENLLKVGESPKEDPKQDENPNGTGEPKEANAQAGQQPTDPAAVAKQ